MLADALHTMTANERWALALQQPCTANATKQSTKTVSIEAGGSEWRAGSRPMPRMARGKYAEEFVVARNYLRACSIEQTEVNEKRQAARAFDGLSHRQVAQMARTSNMTALVSGWQYLCALRGYSVAEADGWLKPAAAAEVVAEVDADLKAMSDRANALAALQRDEVERMGREARSKDQYAKIEVRSARHGVAHSAVSSLCAFLFGCSCRSARSKPRRRRRSWRIRYPDGLRPLMILPRSSLRSR